MSCKYLCAIVILLNFQIQNGISQQAPSGGYLKREHSLIKPYSGAGQSMPMWDFRDNVMVTNNFVRLTDNHQDKRGAIWNKIPVFVHDWEIQLHFNIHGSGRSLAADGLALWYTKNRMEPGPVFGSRDNFVGLGIFLDSYKNGPQAVTFPFISAMVNNGSLKYDHANDGRTDAIGSCLASYRNKHDKDIDTFLIVRYVQNRLTVILNIEGDNTEKTCMDVPGVTLPTGYFIGLSAATGDLADHHEVETVKFYQLDVKRDPNELEGIATAIPSVSYIKPPLDNVDDSGPGGFRNVAVGGFKLVLLIICVLLGVGVCVVVGVLVFQKRQEQNRKRFY